jgi:hypothetical protein
MSESSPYSSEGAAKFLLLLYENGYDDYRNYSYLSFESEGTKSDRLNAEKLLGL